MSILFYLSSQDSFRNCAASQCGSCVVILDLSKANKHLSDKVPAAFLLRYYLKYCQLVYITQWPFYPNSPSQLAHIEKRKFENTWHQAHQLLNAQNFHGHTNQMRKFNNKVNCICCMVIKSTQQQRLNTSSAATQPQEKLFSDSTLLKKVRTSPFLFFLKNPTNLSNQPPSTT